MRGLIHGTFDAHAAVARASASGLDAGAELVAVLSAEPSGALPLPAGVGAPAPLTGLSRS